VGGAPRARPRRAGVAGGPVAVGALAAGALAAGEFAAGGFAAGGLAAFVAAFTAAPIVGFLALTALAAAAADRVTSAETVG
jgi:hypothetical protein